MRKKLFVIVHLIAFIFIFTACISGTSNSKDNDTVSAEMMGESADLISCNDENIKFIGFQKAKPDLTDQEGAYIFVYEYTNNTDEPYVYYQHFNINCFQNGSELGPKSYKTHVSSTKAKDQLELLEGEAKKAFNGGTIRFGVVVTPEDDSPITIMATEIGNKDNRGILEINLIDGTVVGNE